MQQITVVNLCFCGCLTGVHNRDRASVGTGKFSVTGQDRLTAHTNLSGAVPRPSRSGHTGLGGQNAHSCRRGGCHCGICHGVAHSAGGHICHGCNIDNTGHRFPTYTDIHLVGRIDLTGSHAVGTHTGGAGHHDYGNNDSPPLSEGRAFSSRRSNTRKYSLPSTFQRTSHCAFSELSLTRRQ